MNLAYKKILGKFFHVCPLAILVIFIVLIGELVTFCLIKSPILKTLRAGANKGKVGSAKQCSNQIKHFVAINFSSQFVMCKVTNKKYK